MRKTLSIAVCALFASIACAGEKNFLWPEDKMPFAQPHQIAAMQDVAREKNFKPGENREPFIEWLEPAANAPKSDVCMILVSGGSYQSLCDVKPVRRWHKRLSSLGVTCVNLVYRTPRPKGLEFYRTAWADGQRAVRLVRSQAAERGFSPDKIGVMSMSAGSHLAALLALSSRTPAYEPVDALDSAPCNVNLVCAFAIAYGMTDGEGTPNKSGGDGPGVALSEIFKFDGASCPMCMMHGGNDPYSPISSARIYRRLRELGIPAELHVYPDRGHGIFGEERAIEFMRQMNWLPLGREVELVSRFKADGNRASFEREPLWPEGRVPDPQPGQCEPCIEWHMPDKLKTTAIQIIFSGGAYRKDGTEGFEVAPARKYLNSKGMAVVTMKYRAPRPTAPLAKHVSAWQDLQRAIRLVRAGAKRRGLDPDRIGIMGSSAGGHLALLGALSSRTQAYKPVDKTDALPCNVQWAVAIYPAYVLSDGFDGHNSQGGNPDSAVIGPEFAFDESAAPVLFIHGDSDPYSAMGSVKVWERLRKAGVQCALHTLALRKHCFQKKASPGTGSYTWLDRIGEFLHDKGFDR